MRDGKREGERELLSKEVIHNMFDTNKHNNPQELQAFLQHTSYILISKLSTDTSKKHGRLNYKKKIKDML